MKINPDYFFAKGTRIVLEGNNPLLITDPGKVWMVEQGKAVAFSVRITEGINLGKRSFLSEVAERGVIFGVKPAGEEQTALLLTGLPGTRLLQIDLASFNQLTKRSADKAMPARLLGDWVNALVQDTAAGEMLEIKILPATEEVIWVKHSTFGDGLITLDQFHSLAMQTIIDRRQKQKQAEKQRFKEKEENNRLFFDNALKGILSVADPGQAGDVLEDDVKDDSLLAACRLVGRAMKIEIISPSRTGERMAAKDLLGNIANASHIRTRQVALKGEWYKQDNGPLLAYLEEDNRPVALLPLSPSQYRLHDPAGKTIMTVDEQIAARVKPFAVAFYRPFPNKALSLRDILTFGLENCWKRDLATVLLMGLLGGLLGMVIPIATGIVFDTIIPGGDKAQLLQIAFVLVAGALAGFLFQLTRSLAMLRLEGRMDGAVQAAVWDRLLSLPVPFFKEYTSGELAMRAMGISQIRKLLSGVVITTIISSLFSVFNFGLLFYYNFRLAGVATVLIVMAVVVDAIFQFSQIRCRRQGVDISNKIAGLVLQLIGSVAKLRVAGAEKRAFYLWSRQFTGLRNIIFKSRILVNRLAVFDSVFPIITSIVIFYFLVGVEHNTMGAGNFVAFNSALTSFITATVALFQSFSSINEIIPLYEKVKPILQALPEYDDSKSDPGELTGAIEVSHVSFRYKQEAPLVIDNVSLQIQAGEYIGIVGTSGSGKSTLFRILLGFEKPESGQVFYNGQALDNLDIRSVRRQLGVVLQNGQLMSGDIFTNIVGANIYLTMDDVWEAVRMAGLEQDIKAMPMGMHTVVSEGVATLSGGQRQRLLIARAIVNRPKIIYFDEATSALDNRSQSIVSESLDRLRATRVVIAHRLSTVIKCDRIIVLDKGKVIENGSYEHLMERGGAFAELAKRQLA
ncbi:ABC transporter related [Desulfofarcimen acetoxidans DSM 771]|uniref:ABC transporter related n=1 Tax=Desulfofarcimen acetoxidans (strain ATCC 49208 / DSM 771 / KCTC 5769 / VKM B-1644 / 5575) TaxID=485916 RepID=C8W366_DESAS|nr:NHLP bacteriocin export ABC transporter permease/ATPase subunit [Desulfofarcimen acetoxidans]ACV61833.1 ABC transporter related [Desulfofarcimen acetoxidans DSM 771]